MNTVPYGVVFSGGGMLGAVHIGAIRAMEELNIKPEIIAGASIGAMVGAFYSAGMDSYALEEAFKKVRLTSLMGWSLPNKGVIDLNRLKPFFELFIPDILIEDLPIPLVISVTNLIKGKNEMITKGALYDYLIASSAIPAMFKPVIIQEQMYVDGGVTNNLPVQSIRPHCEYVIAIDLRHVDPVSLSSLNGVSQIVQRVIMLSLHQKASIEMQYADIQVPIHGIEGYSMFKNNKVEALIQIGYEQTMAALRAFLDK